MRPGTEQDHAEAVRIQRYLASAGPHANTTVTTKVARMLISATDGWIFAQGYSYDIICRPAGAGMHRITLKERS